METNAHARLRRQSLSGFVLVIVAPILLAIYVAKWSEALAIGVFLASALAMGVVFSLQIHCPNCGANLAMARPYMAGFILFLWLTRETCPRCRARLWEAQGNSNEP